MQSWVGSDRSSLIWRLNRYDEYWDACKKCELEVVVSESQHRDLCRALKFDRKSGGGRGRVLTSSFPRLGLLKGDRLEPTENLRNVEDLEAVNEFPITLKFWMQSEETLA